MSSGESKSIAVQVQMPDKIGAEKKRSYTHLFK